jgi:hypothetical protein
MAITLYRANGPVRLEWYKKTASTAFTYGDLVYLSSGALALFADTVDQVPLGRILKTVAATDSDYAETTRVPVEIGNPNTEYICDVSTGTAVYATHVGTWIDVDDEDSVDVNASTYDTFFVTDVISTSKVVAKMQSLDPYQ